MKSLLKNSSIYLFSNMLSKAIPFLLLPIMTSYLTPEEFGKLSVFLIFISLYGALIGMNMQANISKLFFRVSKQVLSKYIGNILFILMITFFLSLLFTYSISMYYESIFSIPSNYLFIIPFVSLMTVVNQLNTTILRNEQRVYLFGIFEVSISILKVSLTLVLLIIFSLNWLSQVLSLLITGVIFFVIAIFYMRHRSYVLLHYDKEKVKSILQLSIPFIPHSLGGIAIEVSDRLFLEKMIGLEAVGLYSVSYIFGMVIMMFSNSFINAWSPWFYKQLASPTDRKKRLIVKYTYFYILVIFFMAFILSLIAEIALPVFVDEKYYEAGQYIVWIAGAYAVKGVYQIFFPYLVHINRTSFLAISTMVAAIINLVLNYFFIKEFGTIGAAYATLAAYSMSATMVFWYQQKKYYMPWALNKKDYDNA